MRRQGICFNCKEKEYITAWCPKLREPRKYFGKKLEIEKSVGKITKEKLRKFVKRQIENFRIDRKKAPTYLSKP